jgi:hypothetical protein
MMRITPAPRPGAAAISAHRGGGEDVIIARALEILGPGQLRGDDP